MAKEKFNWKGLFIQDLESQSQQPKAVVESRNFPESKITFPSAQENANPGISNEILSKVIEMYEKGFESLNQPGYDFYEFFKSVMATDPNNPQSYVMAYTMASSMDKSINKTFLLSSGDFYQKEVMKVYTKFDVDGRKAKHDLVDKLKAEKDTLQADIKTIQNKLTVLQHELEQKSKLLQSFDPNNFNKIQEIDQKILANDLSKDRIMQKISQVLSGINTHI